MNQFLLLKFDLGMSATHLHSELNKIRVMITFSYIQQFVTNWGVWGFFLKHMYCRSKTVHVLFFNLGLEYA